jgi:acetolactate synthase-1/2/3 large subunit
MTNEINTAVHCGAQAVWIVLNDARYNMCAQGMETLGLIADATFPEVDFASFASAQGALGIRVENEQQLVAAVDQAMATTRPCVLDVLIDPDLRPPSDNRNSGLKSQMVFPNQPT